MLEGPDYPSRTPLRLQTLESALALPWGATLPAGRHRLRGFAWSPAGRINRVEVSVDRGAAWRTATLREPNIPRAWVRRDVEWDARPGEHVILTRATDEHGPHAAGPHSVERAGVRLQRAGTASGEGDLSWGGPSMPPKRTLDRSTALMGRAVEGASGSAVLSRAGSRPPGAT
jgi:hypothetical protein